MLWNEEHARLVSLQVDRAILALVCRTCSLTGEKGDPQIPQMKPMENEKREGRGPF